MGEWEYEPRSAACLSSLYQFELWGRSRQKVAADILGDLQIRGDVWNVSQKKTWKNLFYAITPQVLVPNHIMVDLQKLQTQKPQEVLITQSYSLDLALDFFHIVHFLEFNTETPDL